MFEILRRIFTRQTNETSEFERNNPLGFKGERVDFIYDENFDYSKLDMYQKNHFRRYEFALNNISNEEICGDFACGSGYGSVILSKIASKIIGVDLNEKVISEIKKRYRDNNKVEFINQNLLDLDYLNYFSSIISFETIEHFTENNIQILFNIFSKALKKNGKIIFSTPYLQQKTKEAIAMGHHLTFNIDESKIETWLIGTGFANISFKYQNYISHSIEDTLEPKDFIICIANKT